MPTPRPGSVTAAAVLSIIYGSLFTLCGLCGLAGMAAQGAMGKNFMGGGDPAQAQLQKQLEDTLQNDVPGYQAFQVGSSILGLGESLALLIAGIGLLGMHSWARTLAIVVSLVAMVSTAIQAVYQTVFVIPAMNKAFQVVMPAALQKQAQGPQAADVLRLMQTMMTLVAVLTVIVYVLIIVYLFIIVVLLNRRHVRAAFAAPAGFEGGPLDQDRPPGDYEDDRGWEQRPDDPKDDWRDR